MLEIPRNAAFYRRAGAIRSRGPAGIADDPTALLAWLKGNGFPDTSADLAAALAEYERFRIHGGPHVR